MCIRDRLENGELTSINKVAVFFPLERKVVYGFENELRIIKKDIIDVVSEQKKEEKDKILEFLKRLGLKQARPYEIIENHILPVYESEDWKQKGSRTLIGYIRYIKDIIDKYERESDRRLNANKASWEAKESPLKRLKKSLLIRINKDDEGKEGYDHPENVYLPKVYGNENGLEKLFDGMDVSFVHLCYLEQDIKRIDNEISELKNKLMGKSKKWKKKNRKEVRKIKEQIAKLKEEKSKKVAEWKEFFLKIGVNDIPRVKYYEGSISYNDKYPTTEEKEYSTRGHKVKDWRLSKEFYESLEKLDLKKAEILLRILNKYWNSKYSNYLEMDYKWFYYYEQHKTLPSSFIRDLKEKLKIPTTQNALVKPSEVFLDKPEIREVLGDTVPYLAVKIKNEDFIRTLGINTQANVEGVLNYLKAFIEQKNEDKKKFEKLYKFLYEHFEEDSERIKEEFANKPLIFVPDADNKYYQKNEVLWKDVSNIFGKNRVYLEKYYPELKTFFLEKLGISKKPIPKDYTDVLCSISEKNKISNEDKKVIIRIYEGLNRNLNPDKVENLISEEDWWNDFIEKPIFLTNKEEFWSNDGDIFINDNNELYQLFEDKEYIVFLWLPDGYHPDKIKFFIKACDLHYLSESVEIEPLLEGATPLEKNNDYTQCIQTITPYVLRYLYWRENLEYEKLKENRTLEKTGAIEVYVTGNLRVRYSIKVNEWREINRNAERKCIYHKDKNCIYMESNGGAYNLAVEFSKVFGEIKGLDDFIMNIMSNIPNAENIMSVKNIEPLPEEKKEEVEVEEDEKKEEEGGVEAKEKEEIENSEEAEEGEEPTGTSDARSGEEEEKETGISTGGFQVKKEGKEEWTAEFSPGEVPINVGKYDPEEEKETVKNDKEKPSDKKSDKSQVPVGERTQSNEGLSKKAKEDIGRWGEEYAFRCIKDGMMKKYPDASLLDTEQCFKLEKDGNVIVEVVWLNQNGESGQHYDIEITENGGKIFIEVKSTKECGKDWFQVSKDQWRLMKEKEDKFYIYRVYGAGTKNAEIKKIPDPAKLWKEGYIDAYPINIEL